MKRLAAIILAILFLPVVASAAWVATDDFEAYSVATIVGQTGGSGWSGNWALGGGSSADYTIVSSPAIGTRAASIKATAGFVEHTLSSTQTTGSVYFLTRRNSTSAANGARIRMPAAGGAVEYDVGFYGTDIILFANSGQKVVCSGLSADTWYEVQVEYDTTVPQHRARCRPQLGSWGAFTSQWEPNGGTTAGAITAFGLQALGSDASITYFDRISDTEESTSAAVRASSALKVFGGFVHINVGGLVIR